jgi:outer membrane protein assembly factor BamA
MSLNIIYNWVVKTISQQNYCGAGFAYGNSNEMPFIKQFFNGGTNSIRAFRARSIGPGVMMVHQLQIRSCRSVWRLKTRIQYRVPSEDL